MDLTRDEINLISAALLTHHPYLTPEQAALLPGLGAKLSRLRLLGKNVQVQHKEQWISGTVYSIHDVNGVTRLYLQNGPRFDSLPMAEITDLIVKE